MIGTTISHYRILEELGRGGMGVVYKAHDTKLDRLVALKFLPHHLTANDAEKARFLQEAKAASSLNHPNVCTIYGLEEHDGPASAGAPAGKQQYIEMEYVDGETLRKKVPIQKIDAALNYAIQIGEALGEAHSKGIIHRDIKCDNIMVNSKNQIKVMDFGLAKLKGSLKLTRTSSTVGTLAYMAPEQIQGGEADVRSDMFSFGVVLFEMLTGKMPFRGEHEAAVMYSVLNEEPESITKYRSDVPKNIIQVVDRLLKKSPDDRYQKDNDLLNDLKNVSASGGKQQSPEITSIAVLAFEDMSPQKDQDYLCEGLAEEMINALTKIKSLSISARTSAFAFKGKQLDIREIGKKLNVQSVLEGSVRKSGNRLRITAQLINVEDGYHLWSERYDRELKDVFEIQDEITENVVRALKIVLGEKDKQLLESIQTPDIEAYEYYLRGRKLFYVNEHEESIQMYLRATQIDSRYALAYCGLADCYSWRYMYYESTEANLLEAEKSSRTAIEINPNLAEAHASLALAISLKKQYDKAAEEFEKAIRLNPRLYEVYYFYGRTCFAQGKFAQAAHLYEEAVNVRPEDYQVPLLLAGVYRSLNDESKYAEIVRSGLQKAERHLELNPTDVRALYLGGGALQISGQPELGEVWIERALKLDPNGNATLYNSACFYSLSGKQEKAIDCLERAISNGFAHKEWIENDSDLDPLRSITRFQELLIKMKHS